MRKILTSLSLFLLAFFVLSVAPASAKVLTSENGTITVAKNEVVNDDLLVGAMAAEIDGTVNGDVFVGAQTVKVTGKINGNLHVGTQSLSLDGATISGNVYAGSQNITVTGSNIKGSLVTGTQTLNIDKTSVVGGSILGGVAIVTLDSPIKRNVFIGSGMLTLGDNARIGKDFYYATGSDKASISDKAKVTGTTYKYEAKTPEPQITQKQTEKFFAATKVVTTIITFLGALLIGLLYFKFFGKHFNQTAYRVTNSFWKSVGVGFLVMIALIPGLIVLLMTVIGIPVAGLALMVFSIFVALSKLVVGLSVGNMVSSKLKLKTSAFWTFALGLLLILVVEMIPFVGGLIGFAVFLSGLGALTLQTFSKSE